MGDAGAAVALKDCCSHFPGAVCQPGEGHLISPGGHWECCATGGPACPPLIHALRAAVTIACVNRHSVSSCSILAIEQT